MILSLAHVGALQCLVPYLYLTCSLCQRGGTSFFACLALLFKCDTVQDMWTCCLLLDMRWTVPCLHDGCIDICIKHTIFHSAATYSTICELKFGIDFFFKVYCPKTRWIRKWCVPCSNRELAGLKSVRPWSGSSHGIQNFIHKNVASFFYCCYQALGASKVSGTFENSIPPNVLSEFGSLCTKYDVLGPVPYDHNPVSLKGLHISDGGTCNARAMCRKSNEKKIADLSGKSIVPPDGSQRLCHSSQCVRFQPIRRYLATPSLSWWD